MLLFFFLGVLTKQFLWGADEESRNFSVKKTRSLIGCSRRNFHHISCPCGAGFWIFGYTSADKGVIVSLWLSSVCRASGFSLFFFNFYLLFPHSPSSTSELWLHKNLHTQTILPKFALISVKWVLVGHRQTALIKALTDVNIKQCKR